ncbi:MAG: hypothetical protein KAG53_08285 [Endozoicomonadaceae bacterium]|nr:hypothetical protein [Endozoicomonadaceae bacterium]
MSLKDVYKNIYENKWVDCYSELENIGMSIKESAQLLMNIIFLIDKEMKHFKAPILDEAEKKYNLESYELSSGDKKIKILKKRQYTSRK